MKRPMDPIEVIKLVWCVLAVIGIIAMFAMVLTGHWPEHPDALPLPGVGR